MAMRRVAQISKQLTVSPTAGSPAAELSQIMKELGPTPIKTISRAMYYKALDELPPLEERGGMAKHELVAKIKALSPPPVVDQPGEGLLDLLDRAAKIDAPAQDDGAADPNLQVAKALLLHAANALDEAHTLAVMTSVAKRYKGSDARRDATYAHALVHRQEGQFRGAEDVQRVPNGSVGFESAGIILKGLSDTKTGPHELYPKVLEAAKGLAKGKPALEAHVSKHGANWKAYEFIKLCKSAFASEDPESLEFCKQVMNTEWRLLLDHCLAKAKMPTTASA